MSTPRFSQALRLAIALQTTAILVQAITAGLLLSMPGGRALHNVSAIAVVLTVVLHLFAAILVWRPGGGSPRTLVPAAVMLAFTLAQMALGMAHMKTLHVPLGVLMFGVSVLHLGRIWSGRRPDVLATA